MFAAGASRPWEKAGGRYKYLFLNKLGCEATFSPDLNPCHLDSCLVGGDNEAGLNSHESMQDLECQVWSQLGILSTRLLLPASLVRTKPPTLA